MKASELIGIIEFESLLIEWMDKRRCPLVMVDLFLDYGMEMQAEAARWAATRKDRQDFCNPSIICGPFPTYIPKYENTNWWCPCIYYRGCMLSHANCIDYPEECFSHWPNLSIKQNLVLLLDRLDYTKLLPYETQ